MPPNDPLSTSSSSMRCPFHDPIVLDSADTYRLQMQSPYMRNVGKATTSYREWTISICTVRRTLTRNESRIRFRSPLQGNHERGPSVCYSNRNFPFHSFPFSLFPFSFPHSISISIFHFHFHFHIHFHYYFHSHPPLSADIQRTPHHLA